MLRRQCGRVGRIGCRLIRWFEIITLCLQERQRLPDYGFIGVSAKRESPCQMDLLSGIITGFGEHALSEPFGQSHDEVVVHHQQGLWCDG